MTENKKKNIKQETSILDKIDADDGLAMKDEYKELIIKLTNRCLKCFVRRLISLFFSNLNFLLLGQLIL